MSEQAGRENMAAESHLKEEDCGKESVMLILRDRTVIVVNLL